MWKNIRASVEVFIGQVEYVVGEGHRIRFWHGPWSEPIPLKDLYPGLFACSVSKEAWIFELVISTLEGVGTRINISTIWTLVVIYGIAIKPSSTFS